VKLAKGRNYTEISGYLQGLENKKNRLFPSLDLQSILYGPPGKTKLAFVFMLAMTLLYGYPVYFLKVLPYTMHLQSFHLLFLINTIILWYCLYKSYSMDPGFLPKNVDAYDTALKQVAYFADWKDEGENPLSRLCHTCRVVKPLRSKHCRVSNRCVRHFDHYCPYIYNVVGYRNRHYFCIFVICLTITMVYGDFFVWYMTNYYETDYLLLIGGMIMGMFTCVNIGLASITLYQAMVNLTTNENINKRRYGYLKDANGRFYNKFDQGIKRNLMEYFHLRAPMSTEVHTSGSHSYGVV